MSTGSFPSNPTNRKAILILQQHDVERCIYDHGEAQALLDDEAYVLQWPLGAEAETSPALRNIMDARLVRPGAVLVQSPFEVDIYEDAVLAPQRFALAKHMYFSTLCMYLGAREVNVQQIDLLTRNGRKSLRVNGERTGGSGQVTVESEGLEKFRDQMNLCDEFTGGSPDVTAAESLLRRTGLWSDPNMRTLVELRRGRTNQLISRKIVLSLSSEAKSNLNIVGRLKIPSFVELSAEYQRVIHEQREYELTAFVRF